MLRIILQQFATRKAERSTKYRRSTFYALCSSSCHDDALLYSYPGWATNMIDILQTNPMMAPETSPDAVSVTMSSIIYILYKSNYSSSTPLLSSMASRGGCCPSPLPPPLHYSKRLRISSSFFSTSPGVRSRFSATSRCLSAGSWAKSSQRSPSTVSFTGTK